MPLPAVMPEAEFYPQVRDAAIEALLKIEAARCRTGDRDGDWPA